MHKMPGANIISYMGKTPKLAESVFLASGTQVIGDLEIGDKSSVWFNTVIRADHATSESVSVVISKIKPLYM